MKVILGCLLSAFFSALFNNVHAQVVLSSIQGKVVTENHTPLESSTIILLKARDSSIISSTIIGKNGKYKFEEVMPDDYLLLATSIGYNKKYAGPYHLEEDQTLRVAEIILKPLANQLKEVIITSTRPEIEVRPGKITINIPNSLTAEGSSAFEILRQSPGVRVDNGNNVNIIGRQNALITIDGKTTNLSGEDLAAYLRSLQSSMIEKIELITSGSAKYDASSGGIVNIVLKKGNNIGANGTVTATAGYGKYYKSNVGITFNDRMAKFNIFGSYNFAVDKKFHNFITDRVINFNNIISDYRVDYKSTQKSENNAFNLGADYFITPTQTVGFLVNGFSSQDDFIKDNSLNISNHGVLDSMITAESKLGRHISKINYNLNYNSKLDQAGSTLSADLNYTTFSRSSGEYITNSFYNADWSPYRDPELLENLSPSKIKIWLSKLDFSTPLSKTSILEAGVKYSHASSNNILTFGPEINGEYVPNPDLSNHFFYTENINAAYVNYQNKFDKLYLTMGLRGEQTSANGNSVTMNAQINRNYFSLFPQALLVYKKNSKNEFSLSYNRGITRPAYEDINPFLYYVDPYDYRAGNPNLKPEYSNSIELSHTYNKIIVTSLYASIISNAYEFGFYEQNDSTKVSVKTQTNLGTIYNYGIRFSTPVVINSWWSAYYRIDASYQRYVAYPQNGTLNKGAQDIIFNSIQNFKISETVSAVLSGEYESPNFYGISQNKARYWVNAGIGTQLFNKRGSLRLNVTDIFNTQQDRGSINYQNLNFIVTDKKESQVARLTFTYHFGKASVKAVAAHRTGNEEEQKRIGSGGGGN
ncbi:TonB-dependent receptor domain-containing protein [Mucilaginibacter sp. OK098]|uniref:TonB-dependent receptor domain-containing protein n=1 Tax=Mucilaginibacter sp. OK098 TaxID=1855297 RepID=UPI000916028E|nr:TonB-dependent receptor [Mucilaginibacter sp. OK098]SHN08588.1 Outer membrane receptor proteins, mostly Fe transport [Mucilaginibacter sp. OK098]